MRRLDATNMANTTNSFTNQGANTKLTTIQTAEIDPANTAAISSRVSQDTQPALREIARKIIQPTDMIHYLRVKNITSPAPKF
jgi:hypothetical protein